MGTVCSGKLRVGQVIWAWKMRKKKIRQNTGQNASLSCTGDAHLAALAFLLGSSRAPNPSAGAASAFRYSWDII